jgi:hypothetical protein
MDAVAGFSTKSGAVVALLRGNPVAYAPNDLSLCKKALQQRAQHLVQRYD